MELALPSAVRTALRHRGIEPSSPLGVGAAGLRWSALGRDGRRYAVVHATGTQAAVVRSRAESLASLEHPSIARCVETLSTDDGVVVLMEAEPGTDLGVLLEARGRFSPGEVVGLLAPIAEALGVLHAGGLSHGDVAPANIVVIDGRPVLVDLLGGADALERGTPGFAPPGRAQGPSPEADIASLGLVARALLGLRAGDEPSCAGGDDLAGGGSRTDRLSSDPAGCRAVLAVCASAAGEVGERATALELAAALRRACPALPLDPVDPAVLARLGLRRLSGVDEAAARDSFTLRAGQQGRGRAGRHRAGEQRRARAVRGAALGAATILAATVIAAVLGSQETASEAAVRLTQERAAALVSGDDAALARVTVPGSAAARADRAAADALAPAVVGAAGDAASWELEVAAEQAIACGGSRMCVTVRTITSRGGVHGASGRVVLVVEPDPWRVLEVRDAG